MDELHTGDKRNCEYRNASIIYSYVTTFKVPTLTILFKHLLPKVLPSILVLIIVDFGKIVLYISSLSFLGLGAQPPSPEWGAMLQAGRDFITSHPIMIISPATVIAMTILIINLTGDALRDRLLKGRGD